MPSPRTLVMLFLSPGCQLRPSYWAQANRGRLFSQDTPTETPEPQSPAPQHLHGAYLPPPQAAGLRQGTPPGPSFLPACSQSPSFSEVQETGHQLGHPPHTPRSRHWSWLFHLPPTLPLSPPLSVPFTRQLQAVCGLGSRGPDILVALCSPSVSHRGLLCLPEAACAYSPFVQPGSPPQLPLHQGAGPAGYDPGLRPGRDFHLASAFRSPPASSPA